MKIIVMIFFLLNLSFQCFSETIGPWDLTKLKEVPHWKTTDIAHVDGYTGILYKSIDYLDDSVEVFAYYSAPKQGTMPEGGWPAVIFAHGGGGTAFYQWVKYWNDKGYAAISMDLEGHIPTRDTSDTYLSTPHPGPSRVGVFNDYELPIKEQWYYHAIAQVIIAHTLIASFPEVNAKKIGLMGASWGGTITSTVMGVDNRLAWAIPVYGTGYLSDGTGSQARALTNEAKRTFVNTNYDGRAFFDNVTCPTLWINGTNDLNFSLNSNQLSSQAVSGPVTLRYTLNMPHGNLYPMRLDEIFTFANQVIKGSDSLPVLKKPHIASGIASVKYHSSIGLDSVNMFYSMDDTVWRYKTWNKVNASILNGTIYANVPENAKCLFFTATDSNGLMVSSEYLEVTDEDTIAETSVNIVGPGDWSSIRLYGHSSNVNDFTDEEYSWIAHHFYYFTIEKRHARNMYGDVSSERASAATAAKIVANNSNTHPLFYWNTKDVYDNIYETIQAVLVKHPEWNNSGDWSSDAYDDPDFRTWFVDVVKDMVNNYDHDGVFLDGALSVGGHIGAEAAEYLKDMMADMPGLVVFNGYGPNSSYGREDYLAIADGVFLEHFFKSQCDNLEKGKKMLDDLLLVPSDKVILACSGPSTFWGTTDPKFSLAAFLIIANDNSYYRWGISKNNWSTVMYWYSDFGRYLGAPKAKASVNGYVYTRSFENAEVIVDLEHKTSAIIWGQLTAPAVTNVMITPAKSVLQIGDNDTLSVTVLPENAPKTVVWKSSDETIATVNSLGVVTALDSGSVVITATSAKGNISDTCRITIQVDSTTSIKKRITVTLDRDIVIYPNPITTTLHITNIKENVSTYEIISINGIVLQKGTILHIKSVIDLSKLSKGIYFIQVTNGGKTSIKSFVKL